MNTIKSKLILGIFVIAPPAILFTACSKDDDDAVKPQTEEKRVETYENFEGRITYKNDTLEAYDNGGESGKTASTSSGHTNITHVADVSAPVINGHTLSASGIAFQGNKAYVSYHWNDAPSDYAGAIEVFNITDPNQPTLISGLYFADTDLNELDVQGNEVYAVGGRDINVSGYDPNLTGGAVVEVVRLQGGLLTNQVDETWVPAYSANSVFRHANSLYVVSGNTGGGVFEIDLKKNNYLNLTESDHYSNSKFGVQQGNKMVFLEGGQNSKLHIHMSHQFNPNGKTSLSLSSPTAPSDSKQVLHVDHPSGLAYVSSGSYGLNMYDINAMNGTAAQSFNTSHTGLVNGTHSDHDFVYAAKGSEGLYILDKNDISNILSQFTFNGSANYVRSNNQNIFIAHGTGGLKILAK